MRQFKLILIFFLFIVSTVYASVARPFDFKKWNFKKDIDLAYVLMHDIDNGVLTKSQDKAGSIKSQEILSKFNKLNVYSESLQKIIKKRLTRSKFQNEVELPLLKIFKKYKSLTRNYKNKRFIENPEYTKLIVERNIKKILFLENYFQSRLRDLKSREDVVEKRIDANRSSLKPSKGRTNSNLRSKFSNPKASKRSNGLKDGVKECSKKRALNSYNFNRADGESLDELDQDLNNKDNYSDDYESEYADDYESEYADDYESEYDGYAEAVQGEDELFDL
ncbi:hypothetical protein [Borreliella turdi]|uniref:hypothetical protein n=1 Tax=Borreliella turdi TaxID=57863 RepID=UPI001243CCBF|nr:hypothetical protein [Borreliella turdi]